jgi:hypothetical protein
MLTYGTIMPGSLVDLNSWTKLYPTRRGIGGGVIARNSCWDQARGGGSFTGMQSRVLVILVQGLVPPCERLLCAVYLKLYVMCGELSPARCKSIRIAAILGYECHLIPLKHRN